MEQTHLGSIGTWGKSPGELPVCRRVGRAKAAETLGPAITKGRTPTSVPGVLPHVPAWGADGVVCVRRVRVPGAASLEGLVRACPDRLADRKSTRLNSSHSS